MGSITSTKESAIFSIKELMCDENTAAAILMWIQM